MEILNQIIRRKEELDGLRPLNPEQEAAIMQKFRLDWNYHSNHLGGNTLTYGETRALILHNITAQGKPLQDHIEMTGHNEAIKWIEEIVKQQRPLSQAFIRNLHQLILKESYEVDAITPDGKPTKKIGLIGEYKKTPNHVTTKTGEIVRFSTPEETPGKMSDLIEWYEQKKGDMHPLLLAAEFHYKFIRIHPFDDGNGRTARILMNFIVMQGGYPPVVIKTEDKLNYFAALQQTDAGLIEPFIQYIGENLLHSLEIMIKGAKGESIDEPDDVDKEIALIEHELKSLELKEAKAVLNTKDVLLELFDSSLKKLIADYVEGCLKFQRFYNQIEFLCAVDKAKKSIDLGSIRRFLEQGVLKKEFHLECHFKGFKSDLLKKFSTFGTYLSISFEQKEYIIRIERRIFIKKKYSEPISLKEIGIALKKEVKAHTAFINQKIEKAGKENRD